MEAGCSVALHARDEQALERAAASLGGDVHHVAFDVTDRAAVDAGVAAVEAEIGPLDILVNNAGMQHRAPLLDFPDDAWHRVIETNLTSAFSSAAPSRAGWSSAAAARSSTSARCSPSWRGPAPRPTPPARAG